MSGGSVAVVVGCWWCWLSFLSLSVVICFLLSSLSCLAISIVADLLILHNLIVFYDPILLPTQGIYEWSLAARTACPVG